MKITANSRKNLTGSNVTLLQKAFVERSQTN